jgi:hypothetical protein
VSSRLRISTACARFGTALSRTVAAELDEAVCPYRDHNHPNESMVSSSYGKPKQAAAASAVIASSEFTASATTWVSAGRILKIGVVRMVILLVMIAVVAVIGIVTMEVSLNAIVIG